MTAFVLASSVAFVCLAQKLAQLYRDPRNPSLRFLCLMLAALGVGILINIETIYTGIDNALGVPNIARYFVHILPLVAAAAVQSVFLYLNHPGPSAGRLVAGRWVIFLFAAALMAATFAAGDFPVEAPADFAERYANVPTLRYYMLAYLGFLALAMSDIFRMSMRYAEKLPASPLRLGIRLLTAGSLVGIAYVVLKGAYIAITISGHVPPWDESLPSRYLPVLGIILVAAGVSLAPIVRIGQNVGSWFRRVRLYRQLRPLWQAIVDVNSDVQLVPPRRLPTPGQIGTALYRRVIEIRDGLGDLALFFDQSIGAEAAARAEAEGLPAEHVAAIADAAAIAHAVHYLTTTPADQRQTLPAHRTHTIDQSAAGSYETDLLWLARLAHAYTTSHIVADLRGRDHAHP